MTGVRIAHLRQDYGSVLYTENREELANAFLYNS